MTACSLGESRKDEQPVAVPSYQEIDPINAMFELKLANSSGSKLGLQPKHDVVSARIKPELNDEDSSQDLFQTGRASWYGDKFHGRQTANGERYNMNELTAAHKTLPFGTQVCVRSLLSGKEVLVRINDRGPYSGGRIIDLSRSAADKLGMLKLGLKEVALWIPDQNGPDCGDGSAEIAGLTQNPSPEVETEVVRSAKR